MIRVIHTQKAILVSIDCNSQSIKLIKSCKCEFIQFVHSKSTKLTWMHEKNLIVSAQITNFYHSYEVFLLVKSRLLHHFIFLL